MDKLTEEDLGIETSNDEDKNIEIEKVILNKVNQFSTNNEVSLSVNQSELDSVSSQDVVSSQNCNGCSSSSKIVCKGSECVEETKSLEVIEEGSLSSASQYNDSLKPKQEAKREAAAGVSVALVAITEKIIDLPESQIILELVRTKLKQENITMSQENIMKILKITMELIEKSPLKGLSQKDVAIEILNKLLNESGLDNETMQIINTFLDTNLIGDTIDLIVAASKGQFDINKATKITQGCFKRTINNLNRCLSKIKRKEENKL